MDLVYIWWCLCSEVVVCFAPVRLTVLFTFLLSLCCLHNKTALSEKIILHVLGYKGLCSNSPVSSFCFTKFKFIAYGPMCVISRRMVTQPDVRCYVL